MSVQFGSDLWSKVLITANEQRLKNPIRFRGSIVKLGRSLATGSMNTSIPSIRGYRLPSKIITHAVGLYQRFCLSFRNVEDLLFYGRIEF